MRYRRTRIYLVKFLHLYDDMSNKIKQLSMGKKEISILKTQKPVNIIWDSQQLKTMLPDTNSDWLHVG